MRGEALDIRGGVRPDGLHRIVHEGIAPPALRLLVEAQAITDHRTGHRSTDLLREAQRSLERLLVGHRRPCDDYLDDWMSYLDVEEYLRRGEGYTRPPRCRLLVNGFLNQAGNLSVRFSPLVLSATGHWARAPEWRLPHLGSARIMERPDDELAHVKDVSELTERYIAADAPYRRGGAAEAREIELACRIVNATFWLAVWRLAQRFDVQVGDYVALVAKDPHQGPIRGLEMVDGLREHWDEVGRFLDGFESRTGYAPRDFLAACDKARGGTRRHGFDDTVSRRLRTRSGPGSDLTPGHVRSLCAGLDRAVRYGLLAPAEPEAPPATPRRGKPAPVLAADTEAPPLPPVPHDPPTAATDASLAPAEASDPETGAWAGGPRPPARAPGKPVLRVGRRAPGQAPAGPPRIPARVAEIDAGIQAEFGVRTAHELVRLLNAEWEKAGRRHLPKGSYPTNKANLRFVIRELRLALGTGRLP